MKLKSFGVLKPKKEDFFFAYLLCVVAVLSLWIGCGIAIQKSHLIAKEALQTAVDALAFRYAQGTTVVLANFIFYISIALAIYALVMAIIKNDKKKYLTFVGTLFTAVAGGLGCVFFGTYILSHIFYGIIILIILFGLLIFNCYIYCDAMFALFGDVEIKEEKVEVVEEPEELEEDEKVAKPRVRKTTGAKSGARKSTSSKGKKSKKQTYVKKLFQKKFKDLTKEEQNEYYQLAKRRKKAERLAKEKKENKAK